MIFEKVQESIAYIKSKTTLAPTVGMVLGSGLGSLADEITNPCYIDYADIPHFVSSTAPGHQGRFVIGEFEGKIVICMQGRLHFYEGYPMWNVTYPIRVMKAMGVETVILTNACGGVNESFHVGDFMIIKDHLNFLGTNPLIGQNESKFGPRFCDMSYTYTPALRELARNAAKEVGTDIQEGVYLAYMGPSYETPAEIRMFRSWGADTVGMSTVPEAIVASHCSMQVLAISCITNMAAGVLDQKLTEDEVIETAASRGPVFSKLLRKIVEKLAK